VAGDTLFVHLFAGSSLAGGELAVRVDTGYPWSGAAEIRVSSAPAGPAGLAVRVPAWSRRPRLMLNGQLVRAEPTSAGYLMLYRQWHPGDVVRYELDFTPRLAYPDHRIDAVRGISAIERGPLVYCFEQADQPAGDAPGAGYSAAGIQTRIAPPERLAHAKYGTASSCVGDAAVAPGSARRSRYSDCRHPSRSRTTPVKATPGRPPSCGTGPLSTGSAAGSAATSAKSRPGARSGCSRQYTTGPRSIARQPRTASMRGLGTVSRGETSSRSTTCVPSRQRRLTSA
jgi:hypothetical protein